MRPGAGADNNMRFLTSLLFAMLVTMHAAGAGAWQTIPGTPVALVPPPGFHLAHTFTGFVNDQSKGGIMVTIFPPAQSQAVEEIYNDRARFARAMQAYDFIIENTRQETTATGETITVYSGTQQERDPLVAGGRRYYDKWVGLISHNGLYMVTVQSPVKAGLTEDHALAVFRSIRLAAWNSLEVQVAALPFSFRTIAPFAVKNSLAGAAVTLQADTGLTHDNEPVSVFIIHDTLKYSSQDARMAQNFYLASIKKAFTLTEKTEEKDVRFAGLHGRMLTGSGRNAQGKQESVVLYTAVDDSLRAIYLQATGPKEAISALAAPIAAIAASLRLKEHRNE